LKRTNRGGLAYRDAFFVSRLGIRGKILGQLGMLVMFIISLIWICQIVLLYGFYQNYRSSQLHAAANMILQKAPDCRTGYTQENLSYVKQNAKQI